MSLPQLQESLSEVRNETFSMSSDEVEHLFKSITKVQRTQGINLSISKLTEKVFKAMDAILLDRMREHVLKSGKPL